MTNLTKQGKVSDVGGYQKLIAGIVEHWNKIESVRTGFEDRRQVRGRLPKQVFLDALEQKISPTSDFVFTLTFRDDDTALWFKMKYF